MRLVVLAAVLALAACGNEPGPTGTPEPPRPTTVLVTPSDSIVELSDTLRLVAEVRDQRDAVMADQEVTWTSSDPSVATVGDDGLVTAMATGSSTISAAAGDAEGTATIGVEISAAISRTLVAGFSGCALDELGAASCWGAGILGNGDSIPSELPVPVSGGHTFDQLSLTDGHVCGLTEDGRVLCWGSNYSGESDPSSMDWGMPTPVEVPLPGEAVQVAAGQEFTCAILEDGRALCWGANDEAQLGRGSTSPREGVAEVAGDLRFRQITAGMAHACGLTASGAAYCWGRNVATQVGDGTTSMAFVPTATDTDVRFTQITASEQYTCALGLDRHGYCWGSVNYGRLGNASGPYDGRPVQVVDLENVTRIESGWQNACALDDQGAAYCWGQNAAGVLGTGSSGSALYSSDRPLPVTGGITFSEITVGNSVACGRSVGGPIYCWGNNAYGGLGVGDSALELIPVEIPGGISWAMIEPGREFSCGIDTDGVGYCWGEGFSPNGEGPVPLTGGLVLADLSVSDLHACALTDTGVAYCWGSNYAGALGSPSPSGTDPVAVASDSTFVDIAAGIDFTCAATASGHTYCWGDHNYSRMGDNNVSGGGCCSDVPVPGATGVSIGSVTAGFSHGCGLDDANAAWCWGGSLNGALGTGKTQEPDPAPVTGGHQFQSIEVDYSHTCGLDLSGAAWCWGLNGGRLGTGTTTGATAPVAVSGGMTFIDLGLGTRHTCGVEASGQLYCWGSASYAELGYGYFDARLSPQSVALPAPAKSVSAAILRSPLDRPATCVVLVDGRGLCWGWNDRGELGQPVIAESAVPLELTALP